MRTIPVQKFVCGIDVSFFFFNSWNGFVCLFVFGAGGVETESRGGRAGGRGRVRQRKIQK